MVVPDRQWQPDRWKQSRAEQSGPQPTKGESSQAGQLTLSSPVSPVTPHFQKSWAHDELPPPGSDGRRAGKRPRVLPREVPRVPAHAGL